MESFKDFIKNKAPEYDIQDGSHFAIKLELAYEEMKQIFITEKYRLDYQIKEANRLIVSGKKQFAPDTTNSDVDIYIKDYKIPYPL